MDIAKNALYLLLCAFFMPCPYTNKGRALNAKRGENRAVFTHCPQREGRGGG